MNDIMNRKRDILIEYLVVLGLAVVFYVVSCAPGVLWQDSGMIQYRLWHDDIEGKLGLALAHPLFYILGIIFKGVFGGDAAFKANLLTAICASFAVANMYLLMKLWLKNNGAAIVAAVSLGLSHTFWRHGSICETYDLYIALLLAELIFLLLYCQGGKVKHLYWLAFFNGLAVANHMLGTMPLACYFVLVLYLIVKKKIKISQLFIMTAVWVIGAGPYEFLIIKEWAVSGDFVGTLKSAAFGGGDHEGDYQKDVTNVAITMKIAKENVMYLLMNFPTPNILLAVWGFWKLKKIAPAKKFANVIYALVVLFLVFAFRYTVADRYAFFIPFYAMVAIGIGVGAKFLLEKFNTRMMIAWLILFAMLPVLAYRVGPGLAEKHYKVFANKRTIPYRNEYVYFLQPWRSGYNGCEVFGREALGEIEDNAIIYADNTTVFALLYGQEIAKMNDTVRIISRVYSSKGQENIAGWAVEDFFKEENIYVVTPQEGYCPDVLLENYDFEPSGVLYRCVLKEASKQESE